MAPKKDLVALATREALTEKATRKKKRPTSATEVAPPVSVKRVGEGLPNLLAMMISPFLLRSAEDGTNRQPKATQVMIKGAFLPEDMRVFE